jgi:RNA methyltransferase, TrmH family
MISKNNIKLIKSLSDIKNRRKSNLFITEGEKIVNELLKSDFSVKQIFATSDWIDNHKTHESICTEVSQSELERLSQQKTPNQVLAIAGLPEYHSDFKEFRNQLCLVLDNIQDPGNMGTIIRVCNWYGVRHIICTPDTVDAFNPKVVQASMGAIFRTKIYYLDLIEFLEKYKITISYPITGTFLDGESIYETELKPNGLIILGNESKGISNEIAAMVDKRITIPSFPSDEKTMESLNVAVAGAIILSEYRRTYSSEKDG